MIHLLSHFAALDCTKGGDFLFFPKWYKYLDLQQITINGKPSACVPQINQVADIWLIVAALVELLLRVAALAALAYVLVGSVEYMVSGGEPGKREQAQKTINNALIGLVIAVGSASFVTFIAGRFK